MYTVHVLEGKDLYYKSDRYPYSYVMVYCEGNGRFLFGNTNRIKNESNPQYDPHRYKPMHFPMVLGHKIGFKVFHHRSIFSDVLVAEGEVLLDLIKIGEINHIELDPIFEQKCKPSLYFQVSLPEHPFPVKKLSKDLFFSYVTYSPGFENKNASVGFKHFYIHSSINEGEIHCIYPGDEVPGAKSNKEAHYMTSTGKTHVFEIDYSDMTIQRSFGYHGDGTFVIIPCVYCPDRFQGTMIINIVGPRDHYSFDKTYGWADIRFYGREELFLSRQIPFVVESPGWYSAPLVFKEFLNEPITIPSFYSSESDVCLIRDLIPHIIPNGVITWTRVFSTESSPIDFEKSVRINGLQWPESVCVEIGWKGCVTNLFLKPKTFSFCGVKFDSKKGIKYIHNEPEEEEITDSNGEKKTIVHMRTMDGEKTSITFSEVDPEVSYIMITAKISWESFKETKDCYIRIANLNNKCELSYTRLEYPSRKTIFGIFYRKHGNVWEFMPSFEHGSKYNRKEYIQRVFPS